MARQKVNASLRSRESRSRLKPQHAPYWHSLYHGLAVGYRKTATGGMWQVRKRDGTQYRFATLGKADDHADANGVDVLDYRQAQNKATAFGDQQVRAASGYTVADAVDDYLAAYSGKDRKNLTTTINAHILSKFRDKLVINLTSRKIRQWHNDLSKAPIRRRGLKRVVEVDQNDPEAVRKRKATANRVLTIFKAVLNHAWREECVPSCDAWSKVRPFKGVEEPKIRYLTDKECNALVMACQPDLSVLVRAALFTGCRYGELAALEVRDYDHDAGTIYIRDSKNGKPRHVPLTDDARTLFKRLTTDKELNDLVFTHSGIPWGKNHQSRPMRKACEKAGISPPASFHILRHTYASHLAMKGVSLQVIAAVLGHADTRITEKHYAHMMPSHIADTVRANLPNLGVA